MPTIDLTDEEYAAVRAAIRRAVKDDKFPRASRLDPLRAALAKFDPATAPPKTPPQPKAASRRGTSQLHGSRDTSRLRGGVLDPPSQWRYRREQTGLSYGSASLGWPVSVSSTIRMP
jgi:hypothetical protein